MRAIAGRASEGTKPGGGARHPRLTLAACILASSLAFIDGSVTNVALPAMGGDLHAGAASLQWVINAYLLPLSALLLMGGAAGDHFGRRRLLIGGTALFLVASIGCALASDLALLLAARALQGVGAAILMPNSLAILGHSFAGEERGKAVGTWAAAGAVAAAIGPPLGGWLVDSVGWRAIFYINVPVAAGAILLAWRYVDESGEAARKLDWPGAVLATLGLGALAWGFTIWSSQRSFDLHAAVSLAAGAAMMALFLAQEHRLKDRAMMPLGLFASRAFTGLSLLTFLVYGALGGLLLLLPYLLIEGGGYSALDAGLALLPFPIVVGGASRLMGMFTARTGPRIPLTFGPLGCAVAFAMMTRLDPAGDYWTEIFPVVLVVALGMAGTAAPLTTAVLSSVDDAHTGTASGFNSAIARTGGLMATAAAGAVIAASGAALVQAFHVAAIAGAGMAALGSLTAWLTLSGLKPKEKDAPPPR